jgi:hypothetical protein
VWRFFVRTVRISILEDSKLGDIVAGLNDPVEYVRNVLAALRNNGAAKNPEVRVRLSLQGDRAAPNYQIV